jgi:NAD(P)-dependent dehydrogenase (short-subunit alcohol dehydrogenase family)
VAPFADKVVLITGTARGCGAVLAEAFAKDGATVVGCDVDADAGEAAAEKIRASGGRIDFSSVDVSREQEVEAFVGGTLEAHGRLSCASTTPAPRSSARSRTGPSAPSTT